MNKVKSHLHTAIAGERYYRKCGISSTERRKLSPPATFCPQTVICGIDLVDDNPAPMTAVCGQNSNCF